MKNIQKKILKMVIDVVCLETAYCSSKHAESNISEIATTNIEALAEGEELIGIHCFGDGTV
ncbi:NVEALA domain-containing protein [Parabacteroides pacaensis]|uniref:NVEALA domain-containing protein n=1 Tax=Parabacteroides pacaensis TaxID=2086575 RepID=UPI00131BAC55|nr:NVEALA domain-containing protein [Parabacteroides pacaensis]